MAQYVQITGVTVPSSAAAGSTVNVTVTLKNIGTSYVYLAVGGIFDSTQFTFSPSYYYVAPGATYSFSGSFTMPSKTVTVLVQGAYWTGSAWLYEASMSKTITLSGAVYTGTISKKQLEYNESRATIPASGIPQGKSGLVHIWGKNTMSTSQKLGIAWTVVDPDGVTRESYSTWEAGTTGAGSEHEFIGGRFSLNKAGVWTINVALYMNPSSPTIVASYSGTLCSVIPTASVTEFKILNFAKA